MSLFVTSWSTSDLDELPADVPMQSVGINIKSAGSVPIRHHTLWIIIMCGSELYVFVCSLDSFRTVTAHTPNTTRKLGIISDLWSLRRKPPKYSVSVCISVFHPLPMRGTGWGFNITTNSQCYCVSFTWGLPVTLQTCISKHTVFPVNMRFYPCSLSLPLPLTQTISFKCALNVLKNNFALQRRWMWMRGGQNYYAHFDEHFGD